MPRQLEFTQEIADIICERIADGESLRSICAAADMPSATTVFKWLIALPRFAEQYAHARELQADTYFDQIADIADDATNDFMQRQIDEGVFVRVVDQEHIQRSKLRIEARRWMAGKLRPKKYGEKQEIEHSGSVEVTSKEQRDAAVAAATRADR